MATQNTQSDPGAALKTFEEKIAVQMQEAKARLEQFEATAKAKGMQAEIAAVNGLKTVRQNIDRKLQDLKTTNEAHVARAKADIDTATASLKKSLDDFGSKFRSSLKK